jgi:putative methyltransferase (TIGR04325 family)
MLGRIKKLLADIPHTTQVSTYNSRKLAEVVIGKNALRLRQIQTDKTITYSEFQALALIALGGTGKSNKVLDFGGGGGNHFNVAENLFPELIQSWTILETEEMVKAASKETRDPKLSFVDSDGAVNKSEIPYDVVLCSSSLQYTEDPVGTLNFLISQGSKVLIITRTPMNEQPQYIAGVQVSKLSSNGPGGLPENFEDSVLSYPIKIIPKAEIMRVIEKKYSIRMTINEGQTNFDNVGKFPCFTFYCTLIETEAGGNR